MDWSISFLVIYKLFCLVLGSSHGMLTLILNFVFQNGQKVFDVINVYCCCCCLILLFVLTRFLNIGISQQFNASIFTPLSYLLWTLSYRSYTFFLKHLGFYGFFWYSLIFGFSICSLFGRQLCQNCEWAGLEPYVPSHIAEPPCFFYSINITFRLLQWVNSDLLCF